MPAERLSDLALHPVRLRILSAVAAGDRTPGQLRAALPEIPPATLYRHVNALAASGLLRVVSERRAGGALERTYGLGAGPTTADGATPDDLQKLFLSFASTLISDMGRHLARRAPGSREPLGFRKAVIYASEQDLESLAASLAGLIAPLLEPRQGEDVKRMVLATVLVPDEDLPESDA